MIRRTTGLDSKPSPQVPETKGLTLEEMDEVFGDADGLAVADQERHAAIHKRIGLDAYANGEMIEDRKTPTSDSKGSV